MPTDWFEVDKDGLRKLMERRGLAFVVFELISNAWDEPGVTQVTATLEPLAGRPSVEVCVADDAPEGFADLRHAWTLFAESRKKSDSGQRGRFNLGEKLVLALAEDATILTTTGGVRFDREGRHVLRGRQRQQGSVVKLRLRMTREQAREVEEAVARLVPPEGIATTFNGALLMRPERVGSFEVSLPTEVANAEGVLRRRDRTTLVSVYQPHAGEAGWVYELGIPVVPTGDRYHYDVGQKVPLNLDRDNVPPHFLRRLRAAALNALHARVGEADASEAWVREAAASPECTDEAFASAMRSRFGEKAVMYDPSDTEANHRAVAEGFVLVRGNQLSGGERANLRRTREAGMDPIRPAGRVFKTPKPFDGEGSRTPNTIREAEWTPGMRRAVAYSRHVAQLMLNASITVTIVREFNERWAACYGPRDGGAGGALTFNLSRTGHAFFDAEDDTGLEHLHDLLIHEFGHHACMNHLDAGYHDALTALGAKLARLALSGALDPSQHGFGVRR